MAASELGARLSCWQENAVGRSICDFLPFCDIWLIERLDHESGPHRVSSCLQRCSTEIHHGSGSTWAGITAEIRGRIPNSELCYRIVSCHHHGKLTHSTGAYTESLTQASVDHHVNNRKLSGGFLLASRLRATVDCKSCGMVSSRTTNSPQIYSAT